MRELKQSTAVTVLIGPFIDDTDFKTAETALTVTQAEVRLSKNSGNMAQKNEATSLAHDELGQYTCLLDTTDTNTLGQLRVAIVEAGALQVWEDFAIVTANYWDSKYGTDVRQADLTQMGGVAQSATDLKGFADAGYDPGTNKVQGVVLVDGNTDMRGTNSAALASAWTAARAAYLENISAGAVTAVGPTKTESDAVAGLVWDHDVSDKEVTAGAGGDAGEMLVANRAGVIGRMAISGTTVTFHELDGTTVIFTATLDSATTPTARSAPA